ncbi:MAG: helix-turn-helix domain-containing protein [Vicinamibacteria bacterium]
MDLIELLTQTEGKTLEFKRDLSSPEPLLRTIVAFANTSGGVILIGVEGGTRRVRGVSDPLALEERVASRVSDTIRPQIIPDIEIIAYRNTHVVAIAVWPSPARPHNLIREGRERGVYVRVGSTNRRADESLVAEMGRFARGEGFDEGPALDFNSDAIDFRVASESFARVRRLARRDLETLRLLTRHQGRLVPTVGGLLLFGRDRLTTFPDAWIQAGRFQGVDRARIVDHSNLVTHLPAAIEAAVAFVEKHSARGAHIVGLRREDRWNVPPVAVREAIVNAVAHADYSQKGAPIRLALFDDRLEIENPGLLPFGLTLADLPRGVSKLRNRVIGRVLHELGLMEQWGSGVQRMIAACADSGLAPPVWEEVGTRVRVTIPLTGARNVEVDVRGTAILKVLDHGNGRSTKAISAAIGLSTRATRVRLASLVGRGLVREVGTGPQDPRRLYFRAAP